jgi:hypothetical protein
VRTVFVLQPTVVAEEVYDATHMVAEEFADRASHTQDETSGESVEESFDRVPGVQRLVANDFTQRTMNTAVLPVDTSSRTWHTGLIQEI